MADTEVVVPWNILSATSEVWVRKILTWFRLFDVEKKGYFCQEERERLFNKQAAGLLNEGEAGLAAEAMGLWWEHLFGSSPVSFGSRTVVKWADFLQYRFDALKSCNRAAVEADFRKRAKVFFDLNDKNKDGTLDFEEIVRVSMMFGISRHHSEINAVTLNKDCTGSVSCEQYCTNWYKFFYSAKWDDSTTACGYLENAKLVSNDVDSIAYTAKVPATILQEMGELWVRKMLTVFAKFAPNGKGRMRFENMKDTIYDRVENTLPPHAVAGFKNATRMYWNTFFGAAEQEIDGDKIVTWENFVKVRYQSAKETPQEEKEGLEEFSKHVHEGLDVNADGGVELVEYLTVGEIRGLNRHQTILAFVCCDTDGDGSVSFDEIIESWRLFYYSKEFDTGALAYGTPKNARLVAT